SGAEFCACTSLKCAAVAFVHRDADEAAASNPDADEAAASDSETTAALARSAVPSSGVAKLGTRRAAAISDPRRAVRGAPRGSRGRLRLAQCVNLARAVGGSQSPTLGGLSRAAARGSSAAQ